LNFLEWLRWEFIQDPETGLADGLSTGHFPVVRSQRFELLQRIGMGVQLGLWARVLKVGRSTVTLEHHVIDKKTESLVAYAIVEGLWLGPSRRLVRIPDPFRELAQVHLETPPLQTTLAPPAEPQGEGPLIHTAPEPWIFPQRGLDLALTERASQAFTWELQVRPSDIDIFSHMNAATYVDTFEDALYQAHKAGAFGDRLKDRPGPVQRLVIRYEREALLGDLLEVSCWPAPSGAWGMELWRPEDDALLCRATLYCAKGSRFAGPKVL
jgi:acyl-CoA thioesterase FadM